MTVSSVLRLVGILALILTSLFILNLIHPALAQAPIVRPPSFLETTQQPEATPPGFPINITAVVNSSRPISKVELQFSSSDGSGTISMVVLSGNATLATYFGVIPAQLLNSNVSYYVTAVDQSGFQGTSPIHEFLVEKDTTPPSVQIYSHAHSILSSEIEPTSLTETAIDAAAQDSGTGVKYVIIRYSDLIHQSSLYVANYSLPVPHNATTKLVEGDRYNGIWEGVIPIMPNNTFVIYEMQAVDFAGNVGSDREAYPVSALPSWIPNVDVQIELENLDPASQNMTVRVAITASFIGNPMTPSFAVHIDQVVPTSLRYLVAETDLNVPNEGGDFYEGVWVLKLPLAPGLTQNLFPFDYYVGFNVTIFLDGLTNKNANCEIFATGAPRLEYDRQLVTNTTSVGMGFGFTQTIIYRFDRKPNLLNPIMQVIYTVFVLLGVIAWIPFRGKGLELRIMVLSGLFTFVILLFFTVNQILQQQGITNLTGLPMPLTLLMGQVWSIAAFIAVSLFVSSITPVTLRPRTIGFGKHGLNLILAASALWITSFMSQPSIVLGQGVNYLQDPSSVIFGSTVWFLPQVRGIVLAGLFGPSILYVIMDAFWKRSILKTRLKSRSSGVIKKVQAEATRIKKKISNILAKISQKEPKSENLARLP
ncbi:MAG: hypothetical protein ACLP5V_11490 [Candidatus Bathyarchaeia archaeon]